MQCEPRHLPPTELLITDRGKAGAPGCPGYTGTLRKSTVFSAPPEGAQDQRKASEPAGEDHQEPAGDPQETLTPGPSQEVSKGLVSNE
jgi:hypothetical protein